MRMYWAVAAMSAIWLTGAAASSPPTTTPLIDGPIDPKNTHWASLPTGDQIAAVYPGHAVHVEMEGQSRIHCRVLTDGKLSACVLVSESPPYQGFGAAELKLAPLFQLAPANFGPHASIEVPVRWKLRLGAPTP
jgi:hypothetical protein